MGPTLPQNKDPSALGISLDSVNSSEAAWFSAELTPVRHETFASTFASSFLAISHSQKYSRILGMRGKNF
jgi:hypothetical protein